MLKKVVLGLRSIIIAHPWVFLFVFLLLLCLYCDHQNLHPPTCPAVVWDAGNRADIHCDALVVGNPREQTKALAHHPCDSPEWIADFQYPDKLRDCDVFVGTREYMDYPISQEEKDFPLAFSLLLFENIDQAERLLQAIYRPHNVYCIHVDAKASSYVHKSVSLLARCLPNVLVTPISTDVKYGEISIVDAEIACLHELWTSSVKWRYFINLTGREFPIRTNKELVRIFKAYNGSNDIHGTDRDRRPKFWTDYRWLRHWLPTPLKKQPPPHDLLITKGSTHIAASRDFINFTLHHSVAKDLLQWMWDTRVPDEHYFNTLNHNPQLNIPGAYHGAPQEKPTLTRVKKWHERGDSCHGNWVHGVCNFGIKDLPMIISSPAYFVNKFRMEDNPIAYRCMELWYHNRTKHEPNHDFDMKLYKMLPWVKGPS